MLSPLLPGRQYRIFAAVRRKIATAGEFTEYGDLYRRAAAIVDGRIAGVVCHGPLHKWIAAHAWLCMDVRSQRFANAMRTMGLLCPLPGEAAPKGEKAPTAEELMAPGGLTRERFAAEGAGSVSVDETYSDFDWRESPRAESGIALFSYGEYAPACHGLNYAPFVERAERLARFHCGLLPGEAPGHGGLSIVRREWFCATAPAIAAVHIYFHVLVNEL
jgi:hypothetical protein